jgi:hypothetical protein
MIPLTISILVAISIFLSGCENPDVQRIIAQGTVDIIKERVNRPKYRLSGKEVVKAAGPDTKQVYDPVHGYNFGSGNKPQPPLQ